MSKFMQRLGLNNVRINGGFWKDRQKLIADVVIPFQEDMLYDRAENCPRSHAVENFRIAAGEAGGSFAGRSFQDSDVGKWIEAASYVLSYQPDPALEERIDELIRIIGKAQEEDGYLDTFYTLNNYTRWSNMREHHELYVAGHLMEGAVAYYQATGKDEFLRIMMKNADLLCRTFGRGRKRGYPGHPEVELALLRLYRACGDERFRDLCEYFINERGTEPELFQSEIDTWDPADPDWIAFYDAVPQQMLARIRWEEAGGNVYLQAHAPVREQKKAAGHAVRAMYLYTAMADLASETGDATLIEACRTLWRNIVDCQMYLTGGLGATDTGEAFGGVDYELPNDTVYAETCASVGMVFFAARMLELEPDGEYVDVIEREIYNGALSGMNQDGKGFFYVNPLETVPGISGRFPDYEHVDTRRFRWHICACCPPNLARMIASLGQYIYGYNREGIFVHLYASSEAEFPDAGGMSLRMTTEYPWDPEVHLEIPDAGSGEDLTIAMHIPGWCRNFSINVNGEPAVFRCKRGYAYISRKWQAGDRIVLRMEMQPRRIYANSHVRADAGCTALMRGPVVYCLEECDNGSVLSEIRIPRDAEIFGKRITDPVLGDIVELRLEGERAVLGGGLYSETPPEVEKVPLCAIPYYAWANREEGGMRVWVLES